MASTSDSFSTFAWALSSPWESTVPTPVPCVVTPIMVWEDGPIIDLNHVFYICMSPYNATAWQHALSDAKLLSKYPNLVHNITYGSPISSPPPLSHTFIPPN